MNPWITFFDAMRYARRDVHWDEFMRGMKERPMNQLPVEKNLFRHVEWPMPQYILDTDIASYGFEHLPPLQLENWTEACPPA